MIKFGWVERNPLLSFFIASFVLYCIYGICWTIVIIFTIHLLDRTFKDTEGERIFGKPLVKAREESIIYGPNQSKSNQPKMPNTGDNNEKRPTLETLLYQKRSKCDRRQPLAAVVKNNIQLNSSPNIDLEKRKPIYQSIRSPASPSVRSTSLLMRRNASPFANKKNGGFVGLNNGGSPMNRSNTNTSFYTSVESPLNDSLEVHGSYFINKSVLHSPSAEKPNINNGYFSPSNVTFCKDARSPLSNSATKSSTESVVEALKLKTKRKRAVQELSDETCTKKKRSDNEDVDSTLRDLLPTVQQPSIEQLQISKRKIDEKEVTSTGIQCFIDDDDEAIARKRKKLQAEDEASKIKYGLTQGEINKLSDETMPMNDTEEINVNDTQVIKRASDTEKKGTPNITFKDTVRNIAYDCSFKSVSFADTVPDKKQKDPIKTQKRSLKLSALKNMESPYKKLFNSGCTHNISPASIKKMRKHPVYFTAKINIDEVQQHGEEFGESGVSLKAFRLDQEESRKRVNNLFDEHDSDVVDFKAQPTSNMLSTTLSTSASTNISSGVSTNLFTPSQPSTLPSLIVKSSSSSLFGGTTPSTVMFSLPATSSVSLASLTSNISFPQVTSVVISTKGDAVVTTSILTGSQMQSGLPTVDIQPKSVSTDTPAFTFGTLPTSTNSAVLPPLTSIGAVVLPTQSITSTFTSVIPQITSTSSSFNFSFGSANTSAAPIQQASLQFTSLQKATVPSTSVLPEYNKIAFSLSSQSTPVNANAATTSSTTILPPVSTSAPFNFSFKTQPEASGLLPSTVQNAITSTNSQQQPPAASTSSLFVTSTATLQAPPNVVATSTSIVLPGISFTTTPLTSFTNISAAPIPSVPPTASSLPSIFGQLPTGNIFATSLSTTTTQPPMFGMTSSASTITVSQPSIFGAASSAPPTATLQSLMFGYSSTNTVTTSVTSFNQTVSTTNATSSMPGNVFAPQATNAGFSFASTAPSTGFNFGGGLSQGSAAPSSATTFVAPNVSITQSSIFGQAVAPTTNAQAPQNIFGAQLGGGTTSQQTIFGAPTVSIPSAQNIFGGAASSAPSTQGIFGSNSQSTFGSATQNTFGSATQNTFGSSSSQNVFGATQQPSIFGDSKISSGAFNFGSTAATTAAPSGGFSFGTSTTSSVFGQQTNNVFGASNPTSTGIFGAAKPAESLFGQQPKPTSGFDFSASLSQGPTINFGGATAPTVNGFPPQQQQTEIPKPSFNFGSPAVTPTFGSTPASPAFGGVQQPVFGNAQPFGTPNAGAGGGFTIGSGTSNPPPTRQTQRARRRLRR